MVKQGRISRQWDEASESWADFVRGGKDHYRDEMNNPATFKVIGNVRGKLVLDLSCGEGQNTRLLAKRGARVVGVDFSRRMIELARQKEREQRLGISYVVSDAAHMGRFKAGRFDLVTCFMALMDIERYEEAISEVARVLKRKGRFVFTITHPCFDFGGTTRSGRPTSEWRYKEGNIDGAEKEATHLEVKKYFETEECKISWDMKRLAKPFETTSFHRTLTDYSRALRKNGFMVARLVEPKPTRRGVVKHPCLRKHTRIPHSIIVEALRE